MNKFIKSQLYTKHYVYISYKQLLYWYVQFEETTTISVKIR